MLSKSEVKYIQSLSQKKFRDKENLYVAEGPKIIEEAIAYNTHNVKKIYALQDWADLHKKMIGNIDISVIEEADIERISQLKTPNKALALIEIPWSEGFTLDKNNMALVLDCIQDPGNLGTIIRIGDWFGVKQMICSRDCADIYNSKVVQATMGSIFRVEVFYTDLPEWISSQSDVTVYGAALNGRPLQSLDKIKNGLLVIGNESKGISNDVMKLVQQKITIEKFGHAESLNAAVAAGIILSHLK